MAVPKRRKSQSRTRMRRSQQCRVASVSTIDCPNCGERTLPHRLCDACGFYKGREVIEVATAEA
ncbi:MAG: 50S ribosomal protein L32 [Myxococcales bacterium]|nr:50S ribosomal protein L32 [Myxococcales bacterium]